MKKILIILSLTINSLSFSQNSPKIAYNNLYLGPGQTLNFYQLEFNLSLEDKTITQKREEIKLYQTNCTTKNKNGKVKFSSTLTFNQKGRTTSIQNKKALHQLVYKNDTVLMEYTNNGKHLESRKYTYENNLFSGYQSIKNGEINAELLITFNDKKKITNRLHKYGRNLKKSTEMKYFFTSYNELEKSQLLINKKIKREWNYDCKPEGEIIKQDEHKIDQKNVCNWKEERNDGSYVSYTRTIDKKESFLWKTTFNKDSVLIASEQFLNDTIRMYSFEKNGNYSIQKNYKKNGKVKYSTISTYTNDDLLTYQETIWYGFNKNIYSAEYEYDQNGLMIKTISSSNGKPYSIIEYTHLYK